MNDWYWNTINVNHSTQQIKIIKQVNKGWSIYTGEGWSVYSDQKVVFLLRREVVNISDFSTQLQRS